MNSDVIIDLDLVENSAKALKATPPDPNAVLNDPDAFLSQCGIKVSDKVLQMIQSKTKAIANARHASIIHIDVGGGALAQTSKP